MNTRFFISVWGLTTLASLAAHAQPAPKPPAFQSAFEGYQPYLDPKSDEKPVDWKATNDATAQIGGWRAYAKEAAAAAPAALPPAGPAKPAGPTP